MRRSTRFRAPANAAGFTLIEVVVALAVIAVALVSIGSLVGAGARGSRALDAHLALVEAARTIEADLATRDALAFGSTVGETNGLRWRVDIAPFVNPATVAQGGVWEPVTETITVRAPTGNSMSLSTLRLRRKPPQ